ncbi:MAG: hypothetical protein ACRD2W_18660, partial [Acidimicrobiales bacterium]
MAVNGEDWALAPSPAESHRNRTLLAVAAAVVVGTVAAILVPGFRDRPDPPATVTAGRDPAAQLPLPAPVAVTLDVQVAAGWETLRADGDRLVVGTRRLETRDLALALLARDDAAFIAFPADGTV